MKVHLGCGKIHIPGFFHIDVIDYPHIDLRHEVDRLPMVADASVDLVYACHVLEHFQRRDETRVLAEWYRILKPGGILRVAVPDFSAIVELYTRTKKLSDVMGLLFGRGDFLYNIHFNVYDEESLTKALVGVGFQNVHRYDWRTTEHADIDDYSQAYYPKMSHYPNGQLVTSSSDVRGVLLSLNVEAVKA